MAFLIRTIDVTASGREIVRDRTVFLFHLQSSHRSKRV